MTAALHDRLSAHAAARGESRAGWVARVITAALEAEAARTEFEPAPAGKGGRPPLPRIGGVRLSKTPFFDAPRSDIKTISSAPDVFDGHVGGVHFM